PKENDYMLVFRYNVLNDNLSIIFGEVTWKYKIDELIDKLFDSLNKLINKNYLSVKTTGSLNELLKTLEIMKNCISCKDNTRKYNLDGFHRSINEIGILLIGLEKEEKKQEKS